ncbi:MAG: hypothetical protein WBE26_20145, partial [Phycisphaerae bacterium]
MYSTQIRAMILMTGFLWLLVDAPFAPAQCEVALLPDDCNGNGISDEDEPGDINGDGAVDLADHASLSDCFTGPCGDGPCDPPLDTDSCCQIVDFDGDWDVDLNDVAAFQRAFTGIGDNDSCTTPTPVTGGTIEFSNEGATTDGPPEPTCGFLYGDAQIGSDVWFCYEATCSDELVVSLCGSRYDTKMAVYAGCECPTEVPIVCGDDDCAVGTLYSLVVFQAVA